MDKENLDKALEAYERIADAVSEDHDHDCPTGDIARTVGAACRGARELLAAGSGPAQVATNAYRSGWDNVFGNRQPRGQA